MKKNFILLFLILFSISLYSEESASLYKEESVSLYNEEIDFEKEGNFVAGHLYTYCLLKNFTSPIEGAQLHIGGTYSNSNNYLTLYTDGRISISLNKNDRIVFLNTISKYKKWRNIAKKEEMYLEKEITNINTIEQLVYYHNLNWYHWDKSKNIEFIFSSEVNGIFLIMKIPSQNREGYKSNYLEIIFDYDDILLLEKHLKEDELTKLINWYKEERRKEEKIKEEYNKKIDTLFK